MDARCSWVRAAPARPKTARIRTRSSFAGRNKRNDGGDRQRSPIAIGFLETVERGGVLENITKVLALIAATGSALPTMVWAAPADAPHKAAPATGAIPRVNGHPNFSGVWQVLNTANWDIEPHLARA